MIYNFRYTSQEDYLKALSDMLKLKCCEDEDYNDLMDEFMLFYEVSGSGK